MHKFSTLIRFISFLFMGVLPANVSVFRVPEVLSESEEASDPLTLQMVVSHHAELGTKPPSFRRGASALYH